MTNTTMISTATDAVIYLKNGKIKYGILIDEDNSTNSYQFISSNHFSSFTKTKSPAYIEIIPVVLIEAIETDLK